MTGWLSIYHDANRGGYHARWRDPSGKDTKRKIPADYLKRNGVKPGEVSKRAERIAHQWAVEQTPGLALERAEIEAEEKTLAHLFALFKDRNPNNIAPVTMKKYGESAAHLIEWFDRTKGADLGSIDRTAAAEYVRSREASKPRPSSKTITNEIAILKQLLEWAVEWRDETGVTSLRLVRTPKIEKTETRGHALTAEQIGAILAAPGQAVRGRKEGKGATALPRADVIRAKRIVIVGVTTMLRRTTLYGLQWEWIKAGRLVIPGPVMKTRKPLDVPLAPIALEACGDRQASGPVFVGRTGGRTKHLQSTLDTLAREAGVARFTPHDMRRTGYTLLAEAGVERSIRKVLMGHEAGIDVSDLYDKRMQRRLTDAVMVLDAAIRGSIQREHLADLLAND